MKRWSVLVMVAILGGFPMLEMACTHSHSLAQQQQTNRERLHTYLQERDYEGGLTWLRQLAPREIRDYMARSLAQAAWEDGYYGIARRSVEQIDLLSVRVQMLRNLADAHLAVEQQQEAKEIATQGFALSQKTNAFFPYGWVETFLKTGQEQQVREIIATFNRETSPNENDRAEISTAYLKVGRYEEAFEFAQLIRDRALSPDDYPDPKVELLNSIIDRALQEGQIDFALDVTQAINEKRDRAEALQTIARHLNSQGNRDRALQILDRALAVTKTIESIGTIADRHTSWSEPNAKLLMSLAKDYAQWGQKPQALSLISLAEQSIRKFENQYAFSYPVWSRSGSLQELALLYWELGEKEAAAKSFAIALQEVESLEGVRHKIDALQGIAQLSPKLNQLPLGEKALAIATQEMRNVGETSNRIQEILEIAGIYLELENTTQAASLIEQAQQLSQALEPSDRATLLSLQIANLTGKVSTPENALPLLNELLPNLDSIAAKMFAISIYQTIPGQSATIQDLIPKTIRQIEALEQDHERRYKFRSFARAIALPKFPELALSTVQQVSKPEDRVKMFVTLTEYYATQDKDVIAAAFLGKALMSAKAIPNERQRNNLLIEEARTLASWSGDAAPTGWEWRYPFVIEIAQKLSDPAAKSSILLNIASNYLKAGDKEAALKTLALVPEKDPQEFWQTAMDLEQYDIALQIARKIQNEDRAIVLLRHIAQKYAIAGKTDRAIAILSEATALANQLENSVRRTELLNGIAQQKNNW